MRAAAALRRPPRRRRRPTSPRSPRPAPTSQPTRGSARSNLAQLETLVRGASIFSDPAEKIAHSVHAASTGWAAPPRRSRMRGGGTSTRTGRGPAARAPLAYKHCAAIEAALAADLDKISRDLRAATRSRAEAVKQHAERREMFGKSADREAAPRARAPVFDALPRPDNTTPGSGGVSGARQQQLLIPDQYVTQRADAAQRVEAQVQEVSQIFGRVADLIKDQGESVERIEVNVESAAADVEAAEGELMERLDNMNPRDRAEGRRHRPRDDGRVRYSGLRGALFFGWRHPRDPRRRRRKGR